MTRFDLQDAIRDFFRARAGEAPYDNELLAAAMVALAERTLSDHPEGSAYRIGHPRAVEVEAARVRLQAAVKTYRAAWRPKVIRLS